MQPAAPVRFLLLASLFCPSGAFFSELWCHWQRPSIHLAARNGDLQLFENALFCANLFKKSIDRLDSEGWTALHHASHFGHLELVQELLKHNAVVDYRHFSTGNMPIHLAAQAGHARIVDELLRAKSPHVLAMQAGTLPMQLASAKGHVEVLRVLIKAGVSGGDVSAQQGVTAIEIAAQNGHVEAIAALYSTSSVRGRNAALHWASREGHQEALRKLLDLGVDKDAENSCGWRAVHRAALADQVKTLDILVSVGADAVISARKCQAETGKDVATYPLLESDSQTSGSPLLLACTAGHIKMVQRLLLNDTNVSINQTDVNGYTCLMHAASMGHLPVARWLVYQGADLELAERKEGLTAVHIAATKGHVGILKLLIQAKADARRLDTHFGFDPFMHACHHGHVDAVQLLYSFTTKNGFDKKHDWTALHIAAMGGHLTVLKYLIAKGWEISLKDKTGWSAEQWAARSGFLDVERMLRAAATLHASDVFHFSPEKVADWLNDLNMPQYAMRFIAHKINGKRLLGLTDDLLLGDLGVEEQNYRTRILEAIKDLKDADVASGRRVEL